MKNILKFSLFIPLFFSLNIFHKGISTLSFYQNNKDEIEDECDHKQYLLDSIYLEYKIIDSTVLKSTISKSTFKEILLSNKESSFYNYLDSDFQDNFSKFSIKKIFIKNYGNVEIGIFEYKDYCCSRQGKNYFMINRDKKELTIWYIENIYFENNLIITEFNTRGNLSYDTIVYSNRLNKFIPFCKQ
jgi:hypothetical protein